MPKEQAPGKPTTRRYSAEEKAAAVRMVGPCVWSWAASTERSSGSPASWATGGVGALPGASGRHRRRLHTGVSTTDARRIRELEQENRELKRANEILKRAASFFGAELDRQHKK